MRIYIATLFFISTAVLLGQSQDRFIWSDLFDDDGYYSLLAETSDGIVALRRDDVRYPDRNRDGDFELIKYDENLNMQYAVELRDLEESNYEDVTTIASPEGIAHIYYQTTKSGKVYVSAQLFDYENLRKKDIIDLVQFKMKTQKSQRITELSEVDVLYPLDVILSEDKSKMLITFYQEKVGRKNETYYQYIALDINSGFSVLHRGDFYSDKRSDKYKIADLDISNTGKVVYLLQSFVENVNREFINRKPAYAYEVHGIAGDSTDYIYDIKTKGSFIDKLRVSSDDEGNTYVAGYLREKPAGPILSSYFLSIDQQGYQIDESRDKYRPREIEDMQGKKDTELDDDFKVVDVIVGDRKVYVIKQYRRITQITRNNNVGFRNVGGINNGFNQRETNWDFEELVVEAYGKVSGDMLWSVTNPRRQEETRDYVRPFIAGSIQIRGDDLYLFYNERPENIERLRKREKLKSTDMPGDVSEPMIALINSEGDISYRSLMGEKRYHIPNTGVLIGKRNVYMLSLKSNFDKYKLGKGGLDVLDF